MILRLLLGSNLGDSAWYLSESVRLVGIEVGVVVRVSSVLQNEAWGFESQHDFFNQIIEVETSLAPIDILDAIEGIEHRLGRVKVPCNWRAERVYEDRVIDIDILTLGDIVFENERLKIPHPKMNDRDFVAQLLSEF